MEKKQSEMRCALHLKSQREKGRETERNGKSEEEKCRMKQKRQKQEDSKGISKDKQGQELTQSVARERKRE